MGHFQSLLLCSSSTHTCTVSWDSPSLSTGGKVSSLSTVDLKCKTPWAPMTIRLLAWGGPAHSWGVRRTPSNMQWKRKGLPAPLQMMVIPLLVLHSAFGLPQCSELSAGPNCPILSSCHQPETASVKCFDWAGFWKGLWATANKITSKIELSCLTFQNILLRHLKYCLLHSSAPLRDPKRSSFLYAVCTSAAWDISFCFSLMLFSVPQGEC